MRKKERERMCECVRVRESERGGDGGRERESTVLVPSAESVLCSVIKCVFEREKHSASAAC